MVYRLARNSSGQQGGFKGSTVACKNSKIDHKKLAADLRLLASRFEATANALLVGAPSRPAIGDARDHMTEGGRALLKLVISGLLAQPSVVPPWLKLSTRSDSRRPKFVGSCIHADIGVIEALDSEEATLAEVLRRELRESDAVRKHETHRASDLRLGNVRRRLVFLEAATGWLADRFHVKPRVHPPMRGLLVRDSTGRSRIDLCFDWLDEEDSVTGQFFVSVCRNGSRICSGLASMLEEAAGESPASKQPEQGRFADAMARYDRSCDEMRTVRLTPGKVIPVDQWPEETQVRGSAIVRAQDWNRYVRYVLQVATENERLAGQARVWWEWWEWWETTQVDPSKARPAPLVSPRIEAALRTAAVLRGAVSSVVARAAADSASMNPGEGPVGDQPKDELIPPAATDLAARNILAHFLANENTSTTTEDLYTVSGVSERKTEKLLRVMHARCQRCDEAAKPCPEHLSLLEREAGKSRGWHRATDRGIRVARQQESPSQKLRPPRR